MIRLPLDDVRAWATAAGIDEVGATTAEPFDDARRVIEERKERGLHAGMHFTYGRPERSTDPQRVLAGARSIVVGAIGYHRDRPPGDAGADPAAAVARYVWEPVYAQLTEALEAVADRLRAAGAQAVVLVDDNRMVDRAAAYRAGLGWFGKNTNLLLGDLGSWFVLGSIVTDAVLVERSVLVEKSVLVEGQALVEPMADGCGSCVRCQVACPTGALDVAGELDARRCLAWLLQADGAFPAEYRVALGDRIYGCDDCQTVCPPNSRHLRIHPPKPADPTAMTTVDVLWILGASDDALMSALGAWYIPRRRPEYLRRNALVVLGNIGDPTDDRVRSALVDALASAHEVVAAHAVWAARRLGLSDVLAEIDLASAPSMVVAELARSVEPVAR